MIYFSKSILNQSQIDQLFELYKNCNNCIDLDGVPQDRHMASTVGHFMLTEFSTDEIEFIWNSVKPKLEAETGVPVDLVYARLLKYNKTCFIPNHTDSYDNRFQKENDLSVIIQLNSADKYTGGTMIVSKQLIELEPGDSVFYTYEHEHQVTPIKQGIRYVLNLRCKKS